MITYISVLHPCVPIADVSFGSCQQIDHCTGAPCENGGDCQQDTSTFTCVCLDGYSGLICQHNIDDCDPGPCQNGAECIDLIDGYDCVCLAGFTGKFVTFLS